MAVLRTQPKNKNKLRKKSLQYFSPSSNNTTTTKITPELQDLQNDVSKNEKCTSAVVARSKILHFHPKDSLRSQNNAFNKAIVRHNQLRPDFELSP
jgi:hypothetical protein